MTNPFELETLLKENKISRRQFISQMSALGVAAALPTFLMPGTARASTPQKGGTLRHAMTGGSTSDTLDPAILIANHAQNINFQLRNCLVEIDHKFQPVPELAESWEPSADAKQWIFKLRKGVEFHNGKTMTNEDVIDSISYHMDKESKSTAKPYLETVENIRADGKYTVIFELAQGSADFPYVLGDYHFPIFPSGTRGKEFDKGIGTGGYILENYEPGVSALTRRNPNYWKQGRAHFGSVETLAITDGNARTNALKTNRVDAIDRADVKTVHLFKRLPGINVTALTGTAHFSIPMMVNQRPYNDNNVRTALKLAVDREEMVKNILKGYGQAGNDHPIGPVNRFFAKDLAQRQYDPDKARFYMKKAGMLDHTFNLHASEAAFTGAVDASMLYQESAKKAGIKINVVREPNDGYWSNVWTKKEWCMCYWGGRPAEDMMFSVAYAKGAPWNDTNWANERFNNLLLEARAELDPKKRTQLYGEMQEICRNDSGTVIPMFNQIVEAQRDKIGHGPISAHMEIDGHRNAERWWFKG